MDKTILRLVPKIVCPLMTQGPETYASEICACDIPKTRWQFIANGSVCHDGKICLPREILPDETKEERDPREQMNSGRLTYFNA